MLESMNLLAGFTGFYPDANCLGYMNSMKDNPLPVPKSQEALHVWTSHHLLDFEGMQ